MASVKSERDSVPGLLGRVVGRPSVWAVFVAVLFVLPLVRVVQLRPPAPLPVLGALPEFALTDEEGRPFGSAQLGGRVWIAGLADPSAGGNGGDYEGVARLLSRAQHRSRGLGQAFHAVSFLVGEVDRGRLATFARAHRASPRMWSFLSGPAFAREIEAGWGRRILLVDGALKVRGAYPPSDPGTPARLLRDLGLLVNRGE